MARGRYCPIKSRFALRLLWSPWPSPSKGYLALKALGPDYKFQRSVESYISPRQLWSIMHHLEPVLANKIEIAFFFLDHRSNKRLKYAYSTPTLPKAETLPPIKVKMYVVLLQDSFLLCLVGLATTLNSSTIVKVSQLEIQNRRGGWRLYTSQSGAAFLPTETNEQIITHVYMVFIFS